MYFCLRIDLDYVPWDTPDAEAFGHGEPAMLLRLLDLARSTGHRFHFFVSNRVLRAFPASAEAVLNDGHDLDWFCKHPVEGEQREKEALELFENLGHKPEGLALKSAWPADREHLIDLSPFRFVASLAGPSPKGVKHFVVEGRSARDAVRAGLTARTWTDSTKSLLREHASRRKSLITAVRPQVLAKYDPRLHQVKEILDIAGAAGMPVQTLRQVLANESS